MPVASKTGYEITEAPPAIPFIPPTRMPVKKIMMYSSTGLPYNGEMAMDIEIRYFAAARAAAGVSVAKSEPGNLSSILEHLCAQNPQLAHVIDQCSFLVDSVAVHDMNMPIHAGSFIDVLPRFAGG
jgi:molybdopterin synthase sulfur carrier subunit